MMSEDLTGYQTTYVGLFEALEDAGVPTRPSIASVEIPLIQRDYAQGRETEKVRTIRSSFLEALHDAVTKDAAISLDFVYGDVRDGALSPLDGQQRLTTLFLLHWYVATKTGHLKGEEPWTRFSYATRPSARLFCERLVSARPPADCEGLRAWLIDQPWYLYLWEHDPTIQSMLVMLDDIDRMFGDDDLAEVWLRLNDSENPAISFYVLAIDDMGAGDELYIKMNSRGKPLTDFENFKARFEQVIGHSTRQRQREPDQRIVHKIDGEWADIFWPLRGGDNLVDDEFLRYIAFLIDVCEWRTGRVQSGRLLLRAEQLFGPDADTAEESLDFFEQAFDTWVGEDIPAYFQGLVRTPDSEPTDERPTLFTPVGLEGTDLFEMCCRVYGDMRGSSGARVFPLGFSMLLYAVLIYRMKRTEDFPRRFRVLRDLVEASGDEIRIERMPDFLTEVDTLVLDGDLESILTSVKTFNQAQVADEQRKLAFLEAHPDEKAAVHVLEDHRLLRGTLLAFELEPNILSSRAAAFTRVFENKSSWHELTGALLVCGDYFRRQSKRRFLFGSPKLESGWRTLLTGPAKSPLEDIRQPIGQLLDRVAAREGPLSETYRSIVHEWLVMREKASLFDWRYYLVKYPEMREGASGLFVTESKEMGYALCALKAIQLNSHYRDPFLLAILRQSGVDTDQVYDPLFTGLQNVPRWMRIRRIEIGMRCVENGLALQVPSDMREQLLTVLADRGLQETADGFFWAASQREIQGRLVDTKDRVQVGAELLRRLVPKPDLSLRSYDSEEARGVSPSEAIAST